jgi:phage-related protein
MIDDYRKAFYYDGKSSKDFGLYISGNKTYNAPERNVEKVSVPGRNGDLILSDGSYKNFNYSYTSFVAHNIDRKITDLKSFLLTRNGYCRLEDDYHPKEFKMAAFTGPIDFDIILFEAGTTELTFDCKPQRFLKLGELPISITADHDIYNPTSFSSKPLIKVIGTGSFTIDNQYTITNTENDIWIDCDLQQAYKGNVYKNDKIVVSNNRFPVLKPGSNSITLSGVTLEIIPRWYVL